MCIVSASWWYEISFHRATTDACHFSIYRNSLKQTLQDAVIDSLEERLNEALQFFMHANWTLPDSSVGVPLRSTVVLLQTSVFFFGINWQALEEAAALKPLDNRLESLLCKHVYSVLVQGAVPTPPRIECRLRSARGVHTSCCIADMLQWPPQQMANLSIPKQLPEAPGR